MPDVEFFPEGSVNPQVMIIGQGAYNVLKLMDDAEELQNKYTSHTPGVPNPEPQGTAKNSLEDSP